MKLSTLLLVASALAPALALTNKQHLRALYDGVTDGTVSRAEHDAYVSQAGNSADVHYTHLTPAGEVVVHWRNGSTTTLGRADRAWLELAISSSDDNEYDPARASAVTTKQHKPPAFVKQRKARLLPHLFGQPW
ncbi:uncharacterized protein LOC62_04G006290 [Vanrija pseudolonga]|uniref:Uncharacterized protein n=1 Tax=Vanrija pseudolonga TaxID=143232 RepID=A0AAF0YDF0_9TREE|nr:hypothetical protein LOC62_04G006290 [Vanrija pseudolonga]